MTGGAAIGGAGLGGASAPDVVARRGAGRVGHPTHGPVPRLDGVGLLGHRYRDAVALYGSGAPYGSGSLYGSGAPYGSGAAYGSGSGVL